MQKMREIGLTRIAHAIGVTSGAVRNWFVRGKVPAEQVLPIVRAAEGSITPHDLRPDLYPDKDWMPPGLKRAT
ncbi:MAG: YdaS family helix-turn-helix protein [Pseudomonadota bacterium]